MTVAVDLDGVICSEERTFERMLARPLAGAAEFLKWLRAQGYTVVVYTARSWAEHRMTVEWLRQHELEYDLLVMGKPVCDIWIDDRAIRFQNWEQVRQEFTSCQKGRGGPPVSYPDDELHLGANRSATFEFLNWLGEQDLPDPIVEVGPMMDGRQNPASPLSRFPQFYVNSRALFSAKGKRYLSMDVDAALAPDIVGDVADIDKLLDPASVGTVIMLHVLEHTPRLFEVPDRIHKVLKKDGRLCVQTPWNLRFHGPRPDCWRISDDGYRALFGERFEFLKLDQVETPGRELMPFCFSAVLRKK
jgi:hypothetical protein